MFPTPLRSLRNRGIRTWRESKKPRRARITRTQQIRSLPEPSAPELPWPGPKDRVGKTQNVAPSTDCKGLQRAWGGRGNRAAVPPKRHNAEAGSKMCIARRAKNVSSDKMRGRALQLLSALFCPLPGSREELFAKKYHYCNKKNAKNSKQNDILITHLWAFFGPDQIQPGDGCIAGSALHKCTAHGASSTPFAMLFFVLMIGFCSVVWRCPFHNQVTIPAKLPEFFKKYQNIFSLDFSHGRAHFAHFAHRVSFDEILLKNIHFKFSFF